MRYRPSTRPWGGAKADGCPGAGGGSSCVAFRQFPSRVLLSTHRPRNDHLQEDSRCTPSRRTAHARERPRRHAQSLRAAGETLAKFLSLFSFAKKTFSPSGKGSCTHRTLLRRPQPRSRFARQTQALRLVLL